MLAGRDLEAGGTWLGLTRDGSFAALTNYRDPALNAPDRRSRGELVVEALGQDDLPAWIDTLATRAHAYNPFNLLVGNTNQLFVFESTTATAKAVPPGIHGLSNHRFNTPWPKLEAARAALDDALRTFDTPRELTTLLRDDRPAPDAELPKTGVPEDWERMLSSCFIRAPGYGTRSTSVIVMDNDGQCHFVEQTWDESGVAAGRVEDSFSLSDGS